MPKTERRQTTIVTLRERESIKIGQLDVRLHHAGERAAKLVISGQDHLKVIGENVIILTGERPQD